MPSVFDNTIGITSVVPTTPSLGARIVPFTFTHTGGLIVYKKMCIDRVPVPRLHNLSFKKHCIPFSGTDCTSISQISAQVRIDTVAYAQTI